MDFCVSEIVQYGMLWRRTLPALYLVQGLEFSAIRLFRNNWDLPVTLMKHHLIKHQEFGRADDNL
jgi:hypothetical protein